MGNVRVFAIRSTVHFLKELDTIVINTDAQLAPAVWNMLTAATAVSRQLAADAVHQSCGRLDPTFTPSQGSGNSLRMSRSENLRIVRRMRVGRNHHLLS